MRRGSIHPLMRGADRAPPTFHRETLDSSPHARGRLAQSFRILCSQQIHPLMRGADRDITFEDAEKADSSPHARGRPVDNRGRYTAHRFIPSCEGQTLSVYAAFSRLKHLVVQFAQMPFSTRHTSFSLHIIYRKNIFFAIFPNIFLYFFNPHSVFIVYNNFFTFTHTVIFCVYLYIFKDSCFRPAEILKIFNF